MARKIKQSKKAKAAKRAPAKKAKKAAKRAAKAPRLAHPGMLGDGTEEQNLNQPGNPKARIKKGEIAAAFGSPKK
jgi:hypothetical protein